MTNAPYLPPNIAEILRLVKLRQLVPVHSALILHYGRTTSPSHIWIFVEGMVPPRAIGEFGCSREQYPNAENVSS